MEFTKAQDVQVPPLEQSGGDCELVTLSIRGGLGCPPGDVVIQAPDETELARIKPDGKVELHADTDEVAKNFWKALGQTRLAPHCDVLDKLREKVETLVQAAEEVCRLHVEACNEGCQGCEAEDALMDAVAVYRGRPKDELWKR